VSQSDLEQHIDHALQLLPRIAHLLRSSASLDPRLAGLTGAQLRALYVLSDGGPRSLSELAGDLGVGLPAASEMVDRLVESGLASRQPNPTDRRQVIVQMTPETEGIRERIRALRRDQVVRALERLDPVEWPVFVKSLEALLAGLQDAPAAGGIDQVSAAASAGGRAQDTKERN